MKQTVLVVGATGTVGREVVASLRERDCSVRALVRSRDIAGVECVRGDLRDPDSVERALTGVTAAVYVSPHEVDEEQLAETFIAACERVRARLVFIGVHIDGGNRVSRALRRVLYGRFLPHYRPKFRISERARTSTADAVVLMPTNFFQNDELLCDELLAGVFPIPFERKVNRVDVRDLGVAAARAATDRGIAPGAYAVVGPTSLDGRDCAVVWSAAVGRTVRYDGDEARFRELIARALDGRKREDFLASFAALRTFELATDPKQLAQTELLLGRAPTPYRAYVEDAIARWTARRAA
jgi:uncharacterized protein YbjT (DUF2867 family)